MLLIDSIGMPKFKLGNFNKVETSLNFKVTKNAFSKKSPKNCCLKNCCSKNCGVMGSKKLKQEYSRFYLLNLIWSKYNDFYKIYEIN